MISFSVKYTEVEYPTYPVFKSAFYNKSRTVRKCIFNCKNVAKGTELKLWWVVFEYSSGEGNEVL